MKVVKNEFGTWFYITLSDGTRLNVRLDEMVALLREMVQDGHLTAAYPMEIDGEWQVKIASVDDSIVIVNDVTRRKRNPRRLVSKGPPLTG